MAWRGNKQTIGKILTDWFSNHKKYKDVPICLIYGNGIPVVLDDGAIQCLADYYGISDVMASTKRRSTVYPKSYVRASLNRRNFTLMEEYAYQAINHDIDRYEQGLSARITPEDIVDSAVKLYQVSPEFAWSVIDERSNK